MSENTWGRTETGNVFHNFGAVHAECRKNIKRTEGLRSRASAETASNLPLGLRMCKRCVQLDDEFQARVEASMAPVNPYDQVCEGVVTEEGAAQVAEADGFEDVQGWGWSRGGIKAHAYAETSQYLNHYRALCHPHNTRSKDLPLNGREWAEKRAACDTCLKRATLMRPDMDAVTEASEPVIIARDEADAIRIRAER